MSGKDHSTSQLESLNPAHNRVERYQAGLSLIPILIGKNYPSVKVIKILNRSGVIQEDTDFIPLGTFREKGIETLVPNMVGVNGVEGGPLLERTMDKYGNAVDSLIQTDLDPYQIASWAFLLLGIIHPTSGTGRTQRLFTNYILQKKGLPNFEFPLENGHLDHNSTITHIITKYNQLIQDENDKTGLSRQRIIERIINKAQNFNQIESGFVDELARLFRKGQE